MTATPKPTPRTSATASAKKTTTAPRARKPASTAPAETDFQKAQRLAAEANAALLRETEAEAARHATEQATARNAVRAAEVAARTAEDAATASAAEKAKLDERLHGRPTATIVPEPETETTAPAVVEPEPEPETTAPAVVEEEGEPEPAAPAADEDEPDPDNPRFNANPRQWRMLQWLLAILGLFIGALVAKMFLGFPFWIANNPATWVKAILGTVWYIALIGVGFFGGGLIGFRLQNRH